VTHHDIVRSCAAGCWRDLVVDLSDSGTEACTGSHAPGAFASDYVPLWAGLAAPDSAQAAEVVASLQRSGGFAACHQPTSSYSSWPAASSAVIPLSVNRDAEVAGGCAAVLKMGQQDDAALRQCS